ncbi:MAG: sigma-70 family RNA polymerase sigma factor [Planctomycetota bacterium]
MSEHTPSGNGSTPETPRGDEFSSDVQPGPVCGVCPFFHSCSAICTPVEQLLPSVERARVDPEDLPRLHMGVRLTNAILDNVEILTDRQRQVVQLYYREALQQQEIAERLGITQQAVNDSLKRARLAVGRYVKKLGSESRIDVEEDPFELFLENPDTSQTGKSANTSQSTSHRFG